MPTPLSNASKFLVQTIFDLYIFVILLRVVLHWAKVDGRNPLLQMVARLTHPPLRPIYRVIPGINGLDLAAVLLLMALSMLKIGLLFWLETGLIGSVSGLGVLAFVELLNQLINSFFYTILILTLLSWFSPLVMGPLVEILIKVSEPLLRPIRRTVPPVSGMDFSPMIMMVMLQLLKIIVIAPLGQIGQQLLLYGG